jgi:hypothetical protein
MRIIADRIGAFARRGDHLVRCRNKLAGDRIGGIPRLDQISQVGRHGDRIALADLLHDGLVCRRNETVRNEVGGRPQGVWPEYSVHASPAGGVHTT